MKKLIFIAAILAAGLSSCASADKIRFAEPASVEIVSSSKFTVHCMVENCSAHRVTLANVRVELWSGSSSVATVILADAATVPKCSFGRVGITFRIKFADPLAMLTMTDLESLAARGLTLRGEAVVRSGMGRKKIRFDNYPLNEILRTFDPDGKINFNGKL